MCYMIRRPDSVAFALLSGLFLCFMSYTSGFRANELFCITSRVSFPIQAFQAFYREVISAAVLERYWYRASRLVSALHALSESVACNAEPKYLSESVPYFLPTLHIAHSLREIRRRALRIHDTDCRSLLVTSL